MIVSRLIRCALALCFAFGLTACEEKNSLMKDVASAANPVGYFEIPVSDLDRAVGFYRRVFGIEFTRETVDGYDMALFPEAEGARGATGALAKGDVYVPGKAGPILYFSVASIDTVLERLGELDGVVLYPKKSLGAQGFVAEIDDSEGNRIALHQPASSPQGD